MVKNVAKGSENGFKEETQEYLYPRLHFLKFLGFHPAYHYYNHRFEREQKPRVYINRVGRVSLLNYNFD